MVGLENSSKLLGKFKDTHIATLALKKNDKTIEVNKSFSLHFLKNLSASKEEFLDAFLKKIIIEKQVQSHGCCFNIDKFTENGIDYFLFSKNNNSTSQSFLWLKHDLLNILNPIMGFSDVLLESETIETDELELVEKIHQNSKKMYNQIDKLALLQNLSNKKQSNDATEYQVKDFLSEIADKLLVNKYILSPSKIEIKHLGNVSARIAQHNFRMLLESQLIIFLALQENKVVDFSIDVKENLVYIYIDFGICNIPSNRLKDLIAVEEFISKCEPINSLQTEALNYLTLCEMVSIMNGKIKLKHNNKDIFGLIMQFPIVKHEEDTLERANWGNTKEANFKQPKTIVEFDIPSDLFKQLHELCNHFDGLIILDDWSELALKIEAINKDYQNQQIKQIVADIQLAIRTFDVEKLKMIHKKCKSKFQS